MKIFLTLVVVLSISVALSSASCFYNKLTLTDKRPVCMLDGEIHNIGDAWTRADCQKCTCERSGMQCCSVLRKPMSFDKEACKAIFDKEACSYKVVRKDDPSIPCDVEGEVLG